MLKLLIAILVTVAVPLEVVNGYLVCGNATHKAAEVDEAISQTVERLMKLRAPDWDWVEVFIPSTFQVATPVRLFGRQKTSDAVQTMVATHWEALGLIDLSNFAIATKSLCLDPRNITGHNILERINQLLDLVPANKSGVDSDFISIYIAGLNGLCLNGYPINATLVETLLKGQNQDGSFGTEMDSAGTTIFMLGPMFCLTQMQNPNFEVTAVKDAIEKMRHFIMQQVQRVDKDVFLGFSEIMANEALVALWKTKEPGEDPNTKWSCREVIDTLGLTPHVGEIGYLLHFRLLRLTGASFLDLLDTDYKCVKTDPIPEGYIPKCVLEEPETCGLPPPPPPPPSPAAGDPPEGSEAEEQEQSDA